MVYKYSINLYQGEGLESKDNNGLSDPYCKFWIGDAEGSSHVQKATLTPVWNENIDLVVKSNKQPQLCIIDIYDRDMLKPPDLLGRIIVPLRNIQKMR